jgi:hypothetical protein
VDGSARGLPDSPIRLISAGKINRSPEGKKISVLMGTNQDEARTVPARTGGS